MKFFRSVASLGTKFLRLFSSPMASLPECIPRTNFDLTTWFVVLNHYATHEEVKDFTIEEMVWVKENDIVGHESLFLTTRNGYNLVVDRSTRYEDVQPITSSIDPAGSLLGDDAQDVAINPQDLKKILEELKEKLVVLKERYVKNLIVSSNTSSDKKSSLPTDRVSQIEGAQLEWFNSNNRQLTSKTPKSGLFALFTITFQPENELTLRDLAFIVRSVCGVKPVYKWNDGNCYWFVRTVVSVINGLTHPELVAHEGSKWTGRPKILPNGRRDGLQNFRPSDVAAMVDGLRREIEKDDQRIDRAVAQRVEAENSPIYRRQKEEAEAKVRERDAQLLDKDAQLLDKDAQLRAQDEVHADMRREIEEAEAKVSDKDAQLRAQDEVHADMRREIETLRRALGRSNADVAPVPA